MVDEEIQAKRQMREHSKSYIQLCLRTNNFEPNDADVKACLDLQDLQDVMEHGWVNAKIEGTSSAMNIEVVIDVVGIMIGDPLEW